MKAKLQKIDKLKKKTFFFILWSFFELFREMHFFKLRSADVLVSIFK